MSTFQIVLTLHENDEGSVGVGKVLHAVCGTPRVLSGGGGYLHGRPMEEDGYVAVMTMQKNDPATGACIACTEADRLHAHRVLIGLMGDKVVKRFLIGLIEDGSEATAAQLEREEGVLVAVFREGGGGLFP
jgi:hypothetical protein